jgi:hypothetical protein
MASLVRTLPTGLILFLAIVIGGCSSKEVRDSTISVSKQQITPEYNRKLYKHWLDSDGDCQNTRAEVLIATSHDEPKFKTERRCAVISGKWFDHYSGSYIYDAKKIDVDHIVPLKKAHSLGAKHWDSSKREQFANDPNNLIPVSAKLNRQKGAKDPTKWMPPNRNFHCEYLIRWASVIKKYDLKLAEDQAAETWIQTKTYSCKEPTRLPTGADRPSK